MAANDESANHMRLLGENNTDWPTLRLTSPSPWDTPDNNETSAATNEYACYQMMGFVIYTLVAGALCILGLAGNTAAYVVLGGDREMVPVAKFLLRSLSVADNFFLVVFFFNFSVAQLFSYTGIDRQYFNKHAWMTSRLVTYPLSFVAQTAAIWLNVLIAASRCLSVCWPQNASVYCSLQATRIGVVGVCLFSLVYNIPRWMESKLVVEAIGNTTQTVYQLRRSELGSSYVYQLVYFDALHYIFMFVLPLVLLTVFNSRLIIVYRRFQLKRVALRAGANHSSSRIRQRQQESTEQNVTLIMIVVILTFMVCNVPAKVVQAVWRYNAQPCMSPEFFVIQLSIVLEVLSSAINFVVYVAFLRRFRHRLLAVVCRHMGVATGSRDSMVGSTLQPLGSLVGAPGEDGGTTVEICGENSTQL